jgi:alpha-glucosidase (family GH31 glycosyl hydrolase)
MYPHQGYAEIKDQFLPGENILVAPVLEKGARSRSVIFPPGKWRGDDGSLVEGPCTKTIDAPPARLPWYRKVGLPK